MFLPPSYAGCAAFDSLSLSFLSQMNEAELKIGNNETDLGVIFLCAPPGPRPRKPGNNTIILIISSPLSRCSVSFSIWRLTVWMVIVII